MMERYTLPKSARLHHKSLIDPMFEQGEKAVAFPLRLSWRKLSEEELEKSFRNGVPEGIAGVQMMVTVPKRKLHHAVDRVRMRRRIKECYRLLRPRLKEAVEARQDIRTLSLGFIYLSDRIMSSKKVEPAMRKLLDQVCENL